MSRLRRPAVCGYVTSDPSRPLPHSSRPQPDGQWRHTPPPPWVSSRLMCFYLGRVGAEDEAAGPRPQEEHLPPVAGGRPPLLQAHGSGRGEHHPQLPGEEPPQPAAAAVAAPSLTTGRCFQIELIDRVDDIYRNTSWGDDFVGYGVQIQQVRGDPARGRRGRAAANHACPSDRHREESDSRRSGEKSLQHARKSGGGQEGVGRQEAAGGE